MSQAGERYSIPSDSILVYYDNNTSYEINLLLYLFFSVSSQYYDAKENTVHSEWIFIIKYSVSKNKKINTCAQKAIYILYCSHEKLYRQSQKERKERKRPFRLSNLNSAKLI